MGKRGISEIYKIIKGENMNRLDIYATQNDVEVLILNEKHDPGGYIKCVPVSYRENHNTIKTRSGKCIFVKADEPYLVKKDKLLECIDSIEEKEFEKLI